MIRSTLRSMVFNVQAKNFEPGKIALFAIALVFLVGAFYFVPLPGGGDWTIFHESSRRVLSGQDLYTEPTSATYYSNPPWLVVLLAPLGFLSLELSRAVFSVIVLILAVLLARRLNLGLAKLVLVLLSPPVIYILLHGQVDILVLAGILLPQEWWFIVGLAKPQVAIAMVFGIERSKLLRMMLISAAVILLSLIWFGNWPAALLRQPGQFIWEGHNIWRGVWPFQVIMGIFLLLLGFRKKREEFFIAASPFLSPYAATSSLIGPWLASLTFVTVFEAAIIWASWWGVIIYRYFAGF